MNSHPARFILIFGMLLIGFNRHANSQSNETVYKVIAKRNVFGLNDATRLENQSASSHAKIALTGITTVLGTKEAMLTVFAKPPNPDKALFYILPEGQSEDGIQILKVNLAVRTVKVNCEGQIQTLNFDDDGISSPSIMVMSQTPDGMKIRPPRF
jgi:hypothetical protein